jgi:homoserine dehydrogenase
MTVLATETLRLGLIGFGTVGQALRRLIGEKELPFEVSSILVRDPGKPRSAPVTTDVERFRSGEYDAVVEAMGGSEPAASLVAHFLRRGVPVVTANKALLAERGDELAALAAAHGTALRGEAAVAGGIPILDVIGRSLRAATVHRIAAVLNATSNFVLTRVAKGLRLGRAVEEARRLGFAEADPTLDLSGVDAAQKLSILVRRLGGALPWEEIERTDVGAVTPLDCARAAKLGYTLKPVAYVRLHDDVAESFVAPTALSQESALAGVDDEGNCVLLSTDTVGELTFGGPGAGGTATASAILDDLAAIARGERTEPPLPPRPLTPKPAATRWLVTVQLATDADIVPLLGPVREVRELREGGLPVVVAVTAPLERFETARLRALRAVADGRAFRLLED